MTALRKRDRHQRLRMYHPHTAGGQAIYVHAKITIFAIRNGLLAEHLGLPLDRVEAVLAETGSLIETIGRLRGAVRSLRPYEIPDVDGVEAWLTDNEVPDPEGPGEMVEAPCKRGLCRRWRR